MTRQAVGVLALVLLGAVAGGAAQADPGFKNVALVNECRSIMERAPTARTRYLQLELFNYEMAFISRVGDGERYRLEENLLETCQVVARSNGLTPVQVALSQATAPRADEMVPFYRAPSAAARERVNSPSRPYPERAIKSNAVIEVESQPSRWAGGFQPGVRAGSLRASAPSVESTTLRGLLHLQ